MYVSDLAVVDFRCYTHAELSCDPGVNALIGHNGQGKTNLVEAIGYVSTLGSHRVASDVALVRAGAERAMVRVRVVRGDRASVAELEITPGKANRVRLNRGTPTRARDVLGLLHAVVFAPEDLVLVKGDPDARRRFMDTLMVQLAPGLAGVQADYDRVLRQRSALLKSAGAARRQNHSTDLRTLDTWDAKLAELGAQIIVFRQALVNEIAPFVAHNYDFVSGGQGPATIGYRSSLAASSADTDQDEPVLDLDNVALIEAQMLDAMARLRPRELERGVCLVGPHRDDLDLVIRGLAAKGYASHGESWSLALALRLAAFDVLTGAGSRSPDQQLPWLPLDADATPVLILDDVFAELDTRRRNRLVERIANAGQVFITAAVADDVPPDLGGARFDVQAGEVTRVI